MPGSERLHLGISPRELCQNPPPPSHARADNSDDLLDVLTIGEGADGTWEQIIEGLDDTSERPEGFEVPKEILEMVADFEIRRRKQKPVRPLLTGPKVAAPSHDDLDDLACLIEAEPDPRVDALLNQLECDDDAAPVDRGSILEAAPDHALPLPAAREQAASTSAAAQPRSAEVDKRDNAIQTPDQNQLFKLRLAQLKARETRYKERDAFWRRLFCDAKARVNASQREAKADARRELDKERKREERARQVKPKRIDALERAIVHHGGDHFLISLAGRAHELATFREALSEALKQHGPKTSLAKIAMTYTSTTGLAMTKDQARRKREVIAELEMPDRPWHRWR